MPLWFGEAAEAGDERLRLQPPDRDLREQREAIADRILALQIELLELEVRDDAGRRPGRVGVEEGLEWSRPV